MQQTHTIGLSPWAGQPGYICCPRAENVKARPADWELIECPDCGAECYVTPTAREAARIQPELKSICTACALRLGTQARRSEHR